MELSEKYGNASVGFVDCDVTKEESVERLMNEAEKMFNSPVHCVVNNAGVMGEKEGWKLCPDINQIGVVHGTNNAIKRMRKDEGGLGGVVVNVASILGLFCGTQPKGWQYNTSKSAVVTLSRCLGNKANYDDTGVRIVCLCPSVTKTPILNGCTEEELKDMKKEDWRIHDIRCRG